MGGSTADSSSHGLGMVLVLHAEHPRDCRRSWQPACGRTGAGRKGLPTSGSRRWLSQPTRRLRGQLHDHRRPRRPARERGQIMGGTTSSIRASHASRGGGPARHLCRPTIPRRPSASADLTGSGLASTIGHQPACATDLHERSHAREHHGPLHLDGDDEAAMPVRVHAWLSSGSRPRPRSATDHSPASPRAAASQRCAAHALR